jgi:hypothetical protein
VIVVNDNYRRVPSADVLFAMDTPWIKLHSEDIAKLTMLKWSADVRASHYGFTFIPSQPGRKLLGQPVCRGSSSGFMAAQVAIELCGARHVILVGMDCKRDKNGRAHYFGDHPKPLSNPQPFQIWADEWDSIVDPCAARGVDIVNCSLDTAIRTMRRSTLQEELWPSKS